MNAARSAECCIERTGVGQIFSQDIPVVSTIKRYGHVNKINTTKGVPGDGNIVTGIDLFPAIGESHSDFRIGLCENHGGTQNVRSGATAVANNGAGNFQVTNERGIDGQADGGMSALVLHNNTITLAVGNAVPDYFGSIAIIVIANHGTKGTTGKIGGGIDCHAFREIHGDAGQPFHISATVINRHFNFESGTGQERRDVRCQSAATDALGTRSIDGRVAPNHNIVIQHGFSFTAVSDFDIFIGGLASFKAD